MCLKRREKCWSHSRSRFFFQPRYNFLATQCVHCMFGWVSDSKLRICTTLADPFCATAITDSILALRRVWEVVASNLCQRIGGFLCLLQLLQPKLKIECSHFLPHPSRFTIYTSYRSTLGAGIAPVQWVPEALSLGVKRPKREADHSPPSSAEVKECVELYLHPQYAFMAWCLVKA
jgi:hypothetical protein